MRTLLNIYFFVQELKWLGNFLVVKRKQTTSFTKYQVVYNIGFGSKDKTNSHTKPLKHD